MDKTFKTLVIVGLAMLLILVAVLFYIVVCNQVKTEPTGEAVATAATPAPATLPPEWTRMPELVIEPVLAGNVFGRNAETFISSLNARGYEFSWDEGGFWIDRSALDDSGVSYGIGANEKGEVTAVMLSVNVGGYSNEIHGLLWSIFLTDCGINPEHVGEWVKKHAHEMRSHDSVSGVIDEMVAVGQYAGDILVITLVDINADVD